MKLACLYLAAQLAALAASAPAPLHQLGNLETRPWSHHSPHKEESKAAKGRWKFGIPKMVTQVLVLGGNQNKDARIKNIPWNPPKPAEPSNVLASERPLTTEYLLSHRPLKTPGAGAREEEARRLEPVRQQHRMETETELFEISEMEIAIAIPSRMGTPCHYARLSRERNDMLVVFLAVAFLIVVLTVEAWGSICGRARSVFGCQGAIRLEDDEERAVAAHQPLSIQASEDVSSLELPGFKSRYYNGIFLAMAGLLVQLDLLGKVLTACKGGDDALVMIEMDSD
ncbi:hypothetical protein B0T16DRAFT_384706 [Cercophora newfieldiana]|uniref:Uncharacterized protein n=1 Tax=Cercophora newfieldiana TaxID=92897 RepID=A0AA39YPZ3_9PEZI|nr:hypothetical protein B0T16DRAFT_384706 [Cercophora newfieldiana]